jgi:hypothetical protein
VPTAQSSGEVAPDVATNEPGLAATHLFPEKYMPRLHTGSCPVKLAALTAELTLSTVTVKKTEKSPTSAPIEQVSVVELSTMTFEQTDSVPVGP